MDKEQLYNGIAHVIEIKSNTVATCEFCGETIGDIDAIAYEINHYIKKHDCKLLKIVQLSIYDQGHKEISVAYLGK